MKNGEKPKWLQSIERDLLALDRPYLCVVVDGRAALQLGNMTRPDQIDLLRHLLKGLRLEESMGTPDPARESRHG